MNSISQDQLSSGQLDRLAAQRRLYSDAKLILGIQMVLSVPCVGLWALMAAWEPNYRVFATYWGIGVTLLDIVLFTPWQRSLKQTAAKVQELFDCEVLGMKWNALKAGPPPPVETIVEYASLYKSHDPTLAMLRNWYPPVIGRLPLHLARIVCQRINCWWDAKLRRRYLARLGITMAILVVFVLTLGLISGLTVDRFFLGVLAPLMPAILLGARQYYEHNDAIKTLDRLRSHSMSLWNQALTEQVNPEELTDWSRDLQDEIYEHRRRSPLIFDWIYNRIRRPDEEYMNVTAETLTQEALQRMKKEPDTT